ncbi:MAG TPA: hypothetical protein VEV42_16315, partial [Pyrinomonadaceae bacterium]|nr:hypothetical protein [Pyrinomonadaceae bacterium]
MTLWPAAALSEAPNTIAALAYSPAADNDGWPKDAPESSSRLSKFLAIVHDATTRADALHTAQRLRPKVKPDNANKRAT